MDPGRLQRVNDCEWMLPQTGAMRVPGVIFADETLIREMDDKVPEQVANVATLPGITTASLAMPDIHWGYGFPVGGVGAMDLRDGIISPGGIGYDINCGIRLIRSDLLADEVRPNLSGLMNTLFSLVPAGVGSEGNIRLTHEEEKAVTRKGAGWSVEHGYGWPEDLETVEDGGALPDADFGEVGQQARDRGRKQMGTLGSGNHFLEVDEVEEIFDETAANAMGLFRGQAVVMIHSGSRGFGYQICDDFLEAFGKVAGKHRISLPDRQLACAPISSPEGRSYLSAMACAANYAWANRQALTHWTREGFEQVFRKGAHGMGMSLVYDNSHNIARIEEHAVAGKKVKLCVHRKGATRSFPPGHPQVPERYRAIGQPVLIPGDMGRASYVLVGAPGSMEKSFGSTCHGAGRRMSRTSAQKAGRGRDIGQELYKERGIVVRAREKGTMAEEMPEAYKDVSEVVEVVEGAGLSRKVAKLRPMGVIKG